VERARPPVAGVSIERRGREGMVSRRALALRQTMGPARRRSAEAGPGSGGGSRAPAYEPGWLTHGARGRHRSSSRGQRPASSRGGRGSQTQVRWLLSPARPRASAGCWPIGVEPACAACPRHTTRWRSTPNVPSTAPSGRSSDSSTGPVRCAARATRPRARAAAARRGRDRARRRARAARPEVRRRRGRTARAAPPGRPIDPAAADEPKSERPKRAPFSSA
jgi:hypothetical protein